MIVIILAPDPGFGLGLGLGLGVVVVGALLSGVASTTVTRSLPLPSCRMLRIAYCVSRIAHEYEYRSETPGFATRDPAGHLGHVMNTAAANVAETAGAVWLGLGASLP